MTTPYAFVPAPAGPPRSAACASRPWPRRSWTWRQLGGRSKGFALDHRGERGARALLKPVGLPHTRSAWERRFLRWIVALDGLPEPVMNDKIDALTVDVHWPAHGLVVELDCDQTHGTPWAERRDARRDAYLRRRGKTVRRIGRETFDPPAVALMLQSLLV